eukprot:sb/3470776/
MSVSPEVASKCLVIPDKSGYDTNMFNIPVKYASFLEKILIPNGLVKDRTHKLAVDILSSLPSECKGLVVLCVLKGGYKFCSELVDAMEKFICSSEINMSIKVEFIRLKSYHVKCVEYWGDPSYWPVRSVCPWGKAIPHTMFRYSLLVLLAVIVTLVSAYKHHQQYYPGDIMSSTVLPTSYSVTAILVGLAATVLQFVV